MQPKKKRKIKVSEISMDSTPSPVEVIKERDSKEESENERIIQKDDPTGEEIYPSTSSYYEIKGRTWADLIYYFSSSPKNWYLILPLLIFIFFGSTGNIKTLNELVIACLISLILCGIYFFTEKIKK